MCQPLNEKAKGFSKHARWHYCKTCDVHFAIGPKCVVHGIQFGVADPKTERNIYHMLIDCKHNTTRIDYLEWTEEPEIVLTGGYTVVPGTTYNITSSNGSTWTWTVPPKRRHIIKPVVTLNKSLTGITPENVYEKIKMYILFS